jgi:hypothetical protein
VFRDEYEWSSCAGSLLARATLLISGSRGGERELIFRSAWTNEASDTPILTVNFSDDLQGCTLVLHREGEVQTISGPIRRVVSQILSERALLRSVVVDITSLQHSAIMYVVRVLFRLVPGELFGVYAEPAQYQMSGPTEYDLSLSFLGNQPVPGFARMARTEERSMVAFLGFEGERLSRILEDREHITRVIPVFGVPSYRPGWNLQSLASAGRVAMSFDAMQHVRACPAFSVHEGIMLLEDIARSERAMIVAPLGTRPHTLATAIFAARTESAVAYDHPLEHPTRSAGTGALHVYHLSGHLR